LSSYLSGYRITLYFDSLACSHLDFLSGFLVLLIFQSKHAASISALSLLASIRLEDLGQTGVDLCKGADRLEESCLPNNAMARHT